MKEQKDKKIIQEKKYKEVMNEQRIYKLWSLILASVFVASILLMALSTRWEFHHRTTSVSMLDKWTGKLHFQIESSTGVIIPNKNGLTKISSTKTK